MNCSELRREIGADPNHASPASLEHRASCEACERYAQEMLRFDALLRRAMSVPVPEKSAAGTVRAIGSRGTGVTRQRPRWFAMAASALLSLGIVVGILLVGTSQTTLAKDIVAHIEHEPFALRSTDLRVEAQELETLLRAKGLRLLKPIDNISFLNDCPFRGGLAPHFVVQTNTGPITVILMMDVQTDNRRAFDEGGFHGVLAPLGKGSLAVLANETNLIDDVVNQVQSSIAWN